MTRLHRLLPTLPLVALLVLGACAAPTSASAPAAVPFAGGAHFVGPDQIDYAAILPAPPADGSLQQKAELAELHAFQDKRTKAELAAAAYDAAHEDAFLFATVLGKGFNPQALPKTAALLAHVLEDSKHISDAAKDHFLRNRAYALDKTLSGCEIPKGKATNTSYPSGHTVVGFTAGVVLARLIPERAADILARAREYGVNRMVCGAHYPSDVQASETLATAIALAAFASPAFESEFDAAKAELQAAGLTK